MFYIFQSHSLPNNCSYINESFASAYNQQGTSMACMSCSASKTSIERTSVIALAFSFNVTTVSKHSHIFCASFSPLQARRYLLIFKSVLFLGRLLPIRRKGAIILCFVHLHISSLQTYGQTPAINRRQTLYYLFAHTQTATNQCLRPPAFRVLLFRPLIARS